MGATRRPPPTHQRPAMPSERHHRPSRSTRPTRALGSAFLAGLLLAACDGGGGAAPDLDPLEQQIIRERAAAMFAEEKLVAALDELRPLVDTASPLPEDWTASEQNADNSKSFSFGADAANAGTVAITNEDDIVLAVN